jgi:hypothetical protein
MFDTNMKPFYFVIGLISIMFLELELRIEIIRLCGCDVWTHRQAADEYNSKSENTELLITRLEKY